MKKDSPWQVCAEKFEFLKHYITPTTQKTKGDNDEEDIFENCSVSGEDLVCGQLGREPEYGGF